MNILSHEHAKTHAIKSLAAFKQPVKTLVVSETGDVHANCNVKETTDAMEAENTKYFIILDEKEVNDTEESSEK
jgi:hypothetical protein